MKACFLIPPTALNRKGIPIDRVYGCNYGFDYKPAIPFLQVATYARDVLGWEVRFMDCPAESIGMSAFEAQIRDAAFDVVLCWSTYLSAEEDLAACRAVFKMHPATKFVFMGAGATWKPEEFQVGDQSWILLGEPEHTLGELNDAWQNDQPAQDIDGLAWFVDTGRIERGGFRPMLDVSSLPMPDRRLLLGEYRANRLERGPITVLNVSRGCGFRCTFCTTNALDQAVELEFKRGQAKYVDRPPLRKRTVDQIVAEFEEIAALGYRGVEISDNIFTWGKKRTIEICDRIAPLNLQFICLARANMLHDPEMVAALGRAGCTMVYMGSESFDDGLLDDMVKEIKVKDVIKAVEVCRANGVEPEVSVLIGGSPQENWKTLWNSWRMSRNLGTRFVHFSVALPAPSTEMYDDAIANGWFVDGDFRPADNAREVIVDLPHLSHRQLSWALKVAYAAQYLSPSGIWKQLKTVRTSTDVRHKMQGASRLIGFLAERNRDEETPIPAGRVTPIPK